MCNFELCFTSSPWNSLLNKYVNLKKKSVIMLYRLCTRVLYRLCTRVVKAIPLQARRGPAGSKKLRFPDFVTTSQDGGRLSAVRTGRLYPQKILLVLISVRG